VSYSIRFFKEETDFVLKNKIKYRKWISEVIREENRSHADINYIFCSDEYLLVLNKSYLGHDTYTDVITFPDITNPGRISGDIYISIERILENAVKFSQEPLQELARVMVHGVLHLLGYKDKSASAKKVMTGKENYYLDQFSKM
jgi:probable rRNA maturation factor